MTYKQIEASREIRLWIGQIIVPVVIAGTAYASSPELREFTKDSIAKVKSKFKRKG